MKIKLRSLPAKHYPNLVFWSCFLLLNTLLFLPLYLLNRDTTTFLPPFADFLAQPSRGLVEIFLFRENADIFRLNLELVLLIAFWVNVRQVRRRLYRNLLIVLYLLILVYYAYEGVMLSIYRDEPVFYSHYFLARDGLRFLLANLHLSPVVYLEAALAVTAFVTIVVLLLRGVLEPSPTPRISRASRLALTVLAVVTLTTALAYRRVLANPEMVVSSFVLKVEENVEKSVRLYEEITHFDDATIRDTYNYRPYTLAKKPNIYMLFVESYGSVLYKRPDYKVAYTALLDRTQRELEASGWHTSSILSESTTWGGGSWLSYTSALFGLRITAHPEYLALLDRYHFATYTYPSLTRYLKSQGYRNIWLAPIQEELNDKVWTQYLTFFGLDKYMRYSDFDYHGPTYGWGPAPPDQYILNYAHEQEIAGSDQPSFLFFLTQNSHFPWDTPKLVKDWRTLNTASSDRVDEPVAPDQLSHQVLRRHYMDAIEYQFGFLSDFILNTAEDDAIIVLVGDHQPPRVSRRSDSLETPIHIISRNPDVAAALAQYGFVDGLDVPDDNPILHHEALYSLLVRVLAETGGTDPAKLPAYLPDGVPFGAAAQADQSSAE